MITDAIFAVCGITGEVLKTSPEWERLGALPKPERKQSPDGAWIYRYADGTRVFCVESGDTLFYYPDVPRWERFGWRQIGPGHWSA